MQPNVANTALSTLHCQHCTAINALTTLRCHRCTGNTALATLPTLHCQHCAGNTALPTRTVLPTSALRCQHCNIDSLAMNCAANTALSTNRADNTRQTTGRRAVKSSRNPRIAELPSIAALPSMHCQHCPQRLHCAANTATLTRWQRTALPTNRTDNKPQTAGRRVVKSSRNPTQQPKLAGNALHCQRCAANKPNG